MVSKIEKGRKHQFNRRRFRLPAPQWEAIKDRARKSGLTLASVLLGAFAEVLSRWAKSSHYCLNLTLFNRLPLVPDVDRIVGDFTSLVLLEVDAAGGSSFEERGRRTQAQMWDDLDHRYVGGVRVMRELKRARGEAGAGAPVVFTSMLTLPGSGEVTAEDRLTLSPVFGVSQTPQVWLDHQASEQGGRLSFVWDAADELFPPGMLDDMLAAYLELLERLAAGEDAWGERAPLRLPAAHLALYAAANATLAEVPEGLLHTPFLAQAAARPESPAVISAERTLTYGELRRLACGLGRRLRVAGVEPGSLVGVVMTKGWEQVAAVLAALAAGAAYLPIDAELPRERRDYLLTHGGVRVALTQPRHAALEWPDGVAVLAVDGSEGEDGPWPEPRRGPDDLAYTIFTSGSTGLPKGVMIEHRSALNTILDMNRRFAAGREDRVLGISSLSFDLSVYDLFGLWAAGGAVVLPEAAAGRDPARWLELMERFRVTVWNTVPALLEMLVEYAEGRGTRLPAALRLVLLSGDWLPLSLPARLRALAPGPVEVVSLGGATEAAIWSILHPVDSVDPAWRSIPYGRAMASQSVQVLDANLAPRPVWVPGELYIGGAGLARGYWRDPAKTAASFVASPEGERLYRTGDLGRWRPDGTIELLGREDFQVKVQGHRIELGEIEAALATHPAIDAAVVTAPGERGNGRRLVGYVVPAEGCAVAVEDLRAWLAGRLPGYMVPATLVALAALPLTANGKVDRRALPDPGEKPRGGRGAAAGLHTPIAELLAGIWEEVLSA
ncbi:MAG TPA: amino acid adenylation domain-containing protein, partial [Thermoanaerobaculia bacterium]